MPSSPYTIFPCRNHFCYSNYLSLNANKEKYGTPLPLTVFVIRLPVLSDKLIIIRQKMHKFALLLTGTATCL